MKNVLEYLEAQAARVPDKLAVIDKDTSCTYRELMLDAKRIGTMLAGYGVIRKPAVVFSAKSVSVLKTFLGIVYAGGFYVLLDPTFPQQRITQILSVLQPEIVFSEPENMEKLKEAGYTKQILPLGENGEKVDEACLSQIRLAAVDTDPLYGIFTSGSTGVPKGVVVCHRSVIDFIEVFTDTFGMTEQDVFGNQAPFDFDVSVKDIYSCLKLGATLVLIPKEYFMFPNQVVDMLADNGVTTLVWAVSALCLLNRLHGLKHKVPSAINKILFSGESMPVKQLNQWRAYYPDAMFVNLYGPTEITCNCTYHRITREYDESEKLPIGIPFQNERVFLLGEGDKEVREPGVEGELCVAGTALALGYYANEEATAKAFTRNPLNPWYPETIYRTGDLAKYGEDGLLYFSGRKDFQIKHMGHRIELEEIDAALNAVCGVEHAITFFDEEKNRVVACYAGTAEKKEIVAAMKQCVPEYMIPNVWMAVDEMPLTKNGKTDRNALRLRYQEERKRGK